MLLTQSICCPNCGSRQAERHYLDGIVRTQCIDCDYLLISCSVTARVIEAYIPGANKLATQLSMAQLASTGATSKALA
jgi:Fe-S-cluster-containing dehydrogenase component